MCAQVVDMVVPKLSNTDAQLIRRKPSKEAIDMPLCQLCVLVSLMSTLEGAI